MVLVSLAQRFRRGWVPAVVVAVVVAAVAFSYGVRSSPVVLRWAVGQVQPGTASQLTTALDATPDNAEVIASVSVIGRFCDRSACYFYVPNKPRPVVRHTVVFVFATGNRATTTPTGSAMAVAYLRGHLHARTVVDADGVAAFIWHPRPGTTKVKVPGAVLRARARIQ